MSAETIGAVIDITQSVAIIALALSLIRNSGHRVRDLQ